MGYANLDVSKIIDSPSAITRKQGEMVYNAIVSYIDRGMCVTLDFSEIEGVISAFLNVAIGKLYSKYTSEQLNRYLKIQGVTLEQQRIFKVVIENAKQYYKDKDSFNTIVRDNCE